MPSAKLIEAIALKRKLDSEKNIDLSKNAPSAKLNGALHVAQLASKSPYSGLEDLIPENPYDSDRSEYQIQIDHIVEDIKTRENIIDVYQKWINKPLPARVNRNRKDGVLLSCPLPTHPDKNPSASFSPSSGLWKCFSCEVGGDALSLVAIGLGYDISNYREKRNFREMLKTLGELNGIVHVENPSDDGPDFINTKQESKPERVVESIQDEAHASDPGGDNNGQDSTEEAEAREPDDGSVPSDHSEKLSDQPVERSGRTEQPGQQEGHVPDVSKNDKTPTVGEGAKRAEAKKQAEIEKSIKEYKKLVNTTLALNWREFVPKDTFLWTYLECTSPSSSPEEYNFWHGMMALGLACGRRVVMKDSPNVLGNLFICLLGDTGSGKTRSRRYLEQTLAIGAPYTGDAAGSGSDMGAMTIASPASAEYLIDRFSVEVKLPTGGSMLQPMIGTISFEEIADLVAVSSRKGSTLSPKLIEFFDGNDVSTGSRTAGTRIARAPFASCWSTTQPQLMSRLFAAKDEASGFLNRWIFVGGPEKKDEFFNEVIINVAPAGILLNKIHEWSQDETASGVLEITKEAKDYMNSEYQRYIKSDVTSDSSGSLSRIALLLKKFMLLFAINEMSRTVELRHAKLALKLYDYVKSFSTIRTEAISDITTAEEEFEARVIDFIKKTPEKRATRREIQRKFNEKSRKVSLALQNAVAAELLEEQSLVVPGRRGPVPKFYVYVGEGA